MNSISIARLREEVTAMMRADGQTSVGIGGDVNLQDCAGALYFVQGDKITPFDEAPDEWRAAVTQQFDSTGELSRRVDLIPDFD